MTSKTWFITGASRGFGREWARAALERGDSVAATARDTSALDDLVADQPRVTVTLVGTLEPVDGVLERLGRDVLLVREADGTATHLPVGAVVEVLVAD